MELASHGFCVFSLNHHDGSCEYTEGPMTLIDGKRVRKPIFYDTTKRPEDHVFRINGLKTRVKEFKALIDQISTPNFFSK